MSRFGTLRQSAVPAAVVVGLLTLAGCTKSAEDNPAALEPDPQEAVAACDRFRSALGMESAIEQMAASSAAWKMFPASASEAAFEEARAETLAALAEIEDEDQADCLARIKEGEE